jgi:hypothetical protein
MRDPIFHLLIWVIYPLWLAAGLGDVLCHRATKIRETSGSPESLLHLAQISVIGVAVLMALFVEITVLAAVVMGCLVLTHSILSFVDVSYTDQRRYISPIEQHIHCYLEVLPWMALAVIVLLEWPLVHDPVLRIKESPPSFPTALAILLPACLLAVLPVILELMSTARGRQHLAPGHQRRTH